MSLLVLIGYSAYLQIASLHHTDLYGNKYYNVEIRYYCDDKCSGVQYATQYIVNVFMLPFCDSDRVVNEELYKCTMTPYTTPIETLQQTPQNTPYTTPDETPYETLAMTPYTTPIETPYTTPMNTPLETPYTTPMNTPDETPIETPIETLQLTPYITFTPLTSLPHESKNQTLIVIIPSSPSFTIPQETLPNEIIIHTQSTESSSNSHILIYTLIPLFILIILGIILYCFIKQRKSSHESSSSDDSTPSSIIIIPPNKEPETINLFTTTVDDPFWEDFESEPEFRVSDEYFDAMQED